MKNYMYEKLKNHIGHNIVCVAYGDIKNPHDICIECEDCNEVLVSAENFDFEENDDMKEVAEALTYIDNELRDMGDSYEEIVENLCYSAGVHFDIDNSAEYSDYLKAKSIEAYTKILAECPEKYVKDYITYIHEYHLDHLIRRMVYTKGEFADVNEHPTAKAIFAFADYVQSINNDTVCDAEHHTMMEQIREKVKSLDLELCYVGNTLGYSWFRYFNPNYFFRSNDCFTVGHVLAEDEIEYKLGLYTIHAGLHSHLKQSGDDQGYTVAFNRKEGKIITQIYIYTTIINPFNMAHEDTGIEVIVDTKDLEASAKILASKVNELAERKINGAK